MSDHRAQLLRKDQLGAILNPPCQHSLREETRVHGSFYMDLKALKVFTLWHQKNRAIYHLLLFVSALCEPVLRGCRSRKEICCRINQRHALITGTYCSFLYCRFLYCTVKIIDADCESCLHFLLIEIRHIGFDRAKLLFTGDRTSQNALRNPLFSGGMFSMCTVYT